MQRRRPMQTRGGSDLRRRIAVEAAALRLGAVDDASLPRNSEIEDALREHQRLFQGATHGDHLRRLRNAAIDAMQFLSRFEPRLVGAVLDGTADAHSGVLLHVFSDDPREVLIHLDEHRIPYEEQTRALRASQASNIDVPALLLSADGVAIELAVFPLDGLRQAPLDRVTAKPMRRAGLAAVEALQEAAIGA